MESHALSLVSERHTISGTRSQNDHAMAYAALASMADAVYCVDPAGCITFANTAFETMTGYTLADLRGTASIRLYVPEAEALFTERRRQVYNGAAVPPRVETALLLEDGRRRRVELSVSSLIVEGRIAERIGVLRDLTERQALHDQLEMERAEAQRLEAALQQRSAQSALLSKATTELLATDDPLAFLEHLYDRLATLLDLEIYVHFALAPDGTHLKLAASRGFTPDQRDALRRLEFGQAVCGTVAQTCRPIIVTDVQNSSDPITEVIRALGITAYVCHPLLMGDALFGTLSFGTKTRSQFTDEAVSLIRAISDLIAIAIARKQADAALQQANVELEQRVQERTAELQQAHDALRHEMSERQRVQEALFQQEKLAALGTLLANVAHELNNPLAVAALQLDNLQEAWGFGAWSEDLETLRQAVERCKSVGQSFLALVRQQAPTRRAVALHTVIDDALVLLGRSLEVDGITVENHLAEDLPPLWADVNQLHHVLTNLITNAHHALRQTAPPRHLRLTAAATADRSQVILEVADSGPGIPQELQRRILEPFFTTKSQGEGSGLGLPLCRNIVEGHGGTLHIASQAGHGTTVSVILPAATSEVEVAEASPEPLKPVQGQGRTILLIDDEPAMQRALRRLLQRNGYDITTAANGLEGLAALKERSYEVILCDMRMPDLDGAGFYRELERCYPHLLSHVIFLTGDVLGPEAQAFFAQVDNPQLEKPFKAQDVRRVIQQVLEAR
jgi:PAS domain S-box-containing protein